MSDHDIGDEIPATGLAAIAAYPNPDGGNGYALVLVGDDGASHAFTLTAAKLRQVATIIVNAVQGIPSGTANVMRQLGYDSGNP